MLKKVRLLTHPTLAATSPTRPVSTQTASSPWDAPCPGKAAERVKGRATVLTVTRLVTPQAATESQHELSR